jgi:hypothetical protein
MNSLLPIVCLVTCTKGRHSLLERNIACFLNQNYDGKIIQLVYNNSSHIQQLGEFPLPENREIILINRNLSLSNNVPYTTCSEIFTDAIKYIPEECEIVNFFDDDDLFLSCHVSEGVKGINNKNGYKPYYSYYVTTDGVSLVHNMHEPSIFVRKEHLIKYGITGRGAAFHDSWIYPLGDISDKEGVPTFLYQWTGGTHKISGADSNPLNFLNHEMYCNDEGDGIINPIPNIQPLIKNILARIK